MIYLPYVYTTRDSGRHCVAYMFSKGKGFESLRARVSTNSSVDKAIRSAQLLVIGLTLCNLGAMRVRCK